MLLRHPEQLPHELGSVSEVFLDQLRADHTQEGGRRLIGHGLGEERLTWERQDGGLKQILTPIV